MRQDLQFSVHLLHSPLLLYTHPGYASGNVPYALMASRHKQEGEAALSYKGMCLRFIKMEGTTEVLETHNSVLYR